MVIRVGKGAYMGVLAIGQCPTLNLERMKCLIFDDEMCTLPKVGGEDSKGRRVL